MTRATRRGVLAGLGAGAAGLGAGLAACGREAASQPTPQRGTPPPLKSLAPFGVGCATMTGRISQPGHATLLARHFSQLTPEWEMKMEYILRPDGGFRFDAPDALAAFADQHGMKLFGHALIWYAQGGPAFSRIDGRPRAFADAYRNYVLAVAGRYRGKVSGWDVVNEAVAEDGNGLRDSLWSRNLGELDYMRRAFDHAREAEPEAPLFLNDYNLESRPAKRATFLRLVERLLEAGAPLSGLGTQSHLNADLAPGAYARMIRELAAFGLPIHVSEIDVSLNRAAGPFSDRAALRAAQARLYGEAAEAFSALPERQRFAFTVWGVKDDESWLRSTAENPRPPWDEPLLFDDQGMAKASFWAVADGLA